MIEKILGCWFILLLKSPGVFASSLTLEQAIFEAFQNSPQISIAKAALDEASWKPLEAISPHIPQISSSIYHFSALKFQYLNFALPGLQPQKFNFVSPYTGAVLELSWTLFDGLASIKLFKAALKNASALEDQFHWTQFKLEQEVRLGFYQVIANQTLEEVDQQNVQRLESDLERIQNLLADGSATQLDVLRFEVKLIEARSALDASKDVTFIARKQLSELMGSPDDERPLQGELPKPRPEVIEAAQLSDALIRADLQALEKNTLATAEREAAANSYWIPKIVLKAQYQKYNNQKQDDFAIAQYPDAYNVGLFFNFAIDAATIARGAQSIYQKVQAESLLTLRRNQIPTHFESWKRKLLTSSKMYLAKLDDIKKSEESLRLSQEGLRAGTQTSSEVLDALRDLFNSKAAKIRSQLNALEAQIYLELALGKKL